MLCGTPGFLGTPWTAASARPTSDFRILSTRGPPLGAHFTALWAALKRVGITATSATSWTWPDGAVINPTDFCPVTIQEL
eukprot:675160-Pyramimonas_sp.AAC.1